MVCILIEFGFTPFVRPTPFKENHIAKNRNTYAKRQREQDKRQRADDKRSKREKKIARPNSNEIPPDMASRTFSPNSEESVETALPDLPQP